MIESYTYDDAQRLASLTHDEVGTAYDQSITLTYNPAHQIVTRTATNDVYAFTGLANENTNGASNGLNQLTQVGAKSLSHDARGNLTAVGTDTYAYSSENLLTSATVGGASSSLVYDPLLRLSQVSGTSPYITQFAYDGIDKVAEYYSGTLVGRHVIDPVTGQPLVTYLSGDTSTRIFLSPDERGSIMANTNSAGSLVYGNPYDEFGQPMPWNQYRYQYTGQAWLSEVKLYYYKARMYSPALGRFMQTDPIGYGPSPNLYAYVLNDPVNLVDPLGLQSCAGRGPCPNPGDIVITGLLFWSSGLGTSVRPGNQQAPWLDKRPRDPRAENEKEREKQPTKTQCLIYAARENALGLGLDVAGWALIAAFPGGSAARAIGAAAIGAAGIGGAVAEKDPLAGGLAYGGRQAAIAEGLFKGPASKAFGRISFSGLLGSTIYDVTKATMDYKACMEGSAGS